MILFQMYKVIKIVRSILERIDSASEVMAEDVAHVRQLVASGGLLASIFSFAFGARKRQKQKKKSDEVDD